MAHQSGIEPSDELKKLLPRALKGSLRFLKVSIANESLVPAKYSEPKGSWENDLEDLVQPVLEDKNPCYVFYRLDERNAYQNFLWVFMTYIPDYASVKDKMLYAATKATLRKAFQSGIIVDDVQATTKSELSLAGYKKHMESQKAAPPLTQAEQDLIMIREGEEHADIGTSTRQSHMHGIAFPIDQDALDCLVKLRNGRLTYVQMSVDVDREEIKLEVAKDGVKADSIKDFVPEGVARYHFFRFHHTFEGDYQEAIVFIYTSPGFKSTIKERMLYASCKEPLIGVAEQKLDITITKKIETDSGSELNEKFIMDEVHPPKVIINQKFMRPPPPNRKRSRSPHRPVINDS